ncbi:MAG: hypothetical protein B7733_22470 [Myxococcales bacterium FL481]|nr:MAG: hypothetical protein B7733_22470 [Myxococcales bacterium FL481]
MTQSTGTVPSQMAPPEVVTFDEDLAGPERWMLGAVTEGDQYQGPYWIYILDRQGRVVWYYQDAEKQRMMAFPRTSRDGRFIATERKTFNNTDSGVHMMTLDHEYSEIAELSGMCDAFDFTDSGSIIYNTLEREGGQLVRSRLNEWTADGDTREIWDCGPWAEQYHGNGPLDRKWCYSNTVDWYPEQNWITLSLPYQNTVLVIDRESGEIVHEWGDLADWTFEPSEVSFDFNHWANFAEDGKFWVSSHVNSGHAFVEFEIDEDEQTLRELWRFGDDVDFRPKSKGMVELMPGGTVLANYGDDAVLMEITREGDVAWELHWRRSGDKRVLGHNILVPSLYDLNRGPESKTLTRRPR